MMDEFEFRGDERSDVIANGVPLHLFCKKHWQPVPDEYETENPINGIVMSVMLTQLWLGEAKGQRKDGSFVLPDGPACCYFGDEKMRLLYRACRRDLLEAELTGDLSKPGALDEYLKEVEVLMLSEEGMGYA